MKSDEIIITQNLDDNTLIKLPEIRNEIKELTAAIDSICIESLPWDKYDFLCVFFAGILGGLVDIFLGKPGGYKEPEIKNNSFFGLGKWLKDYDLKNNPIDKQIDGTFGGDHRLYSYGHDLFRFFDGVKLILEGKGHVGIYGNAGNIESGFIGNLYDEFGKRQRFELVSVPQNYTAPKSVWAAVIVLALHLYKDFWTARSLPIPGSTIIADLNNHKMPEWLHTLTNDKSVNLRTLSAQGLSISVCELIPWLYLKMKYHNKDVSKEMIDEKMDKMKLIAHTTSLLFNTGKVIATKNPFLLNYGQIIRIVHLAAKTIAKDLETTHKAKEKVSLHIHKNKLELLETMIITESAMVITKNVNAYVRDGVFELQEKIDLSILERKNKIDQFNEKLKEFSNFAKNMEE